MKIEKIKNGEEQNLTQLLRSIQTIKKKINLIFHPTSFKVTRILLKSHRITFTSFYYLGNSLRTSLNVVQI